jgi:CarD family transcriptional regulator
MSNKPNGLDFKVGDFVVYPAHGVGHVIGVETQEVAGLSLEVYVITFDHEKMTLRVPTKKAKTAGLRPLADQDVVSKSLSTLKGRARVKRTMWSRRAQEYEAKINSGDLVSIAEVVRDLHRAENQPEQSYSERQLYESALDRMAREVAAIERIDREAAVALLTKSLTKAA